MLWGCFRLIDLQFLRWIRTSRRWWYLDNPMCVLILYKSIFFVPLILRTGCHLYHALMRFSSSRMALWPSRNICVLVSVMHMMCQPWTWVQTITLDLGPFNRRKQKSHNYSKGSLFCCWSPAPKIGNHATSDEPQGSRISCHLADSYYGPYLQTLMKLEVRSGLRYSIHGLGPYCDLGIA